jgi:hypothetical protein
LMHSKKMAGLTCPADNLGTNPSGRNAKQNCTASIGNSLFPPWQ